MLLNGGNTLGIFNDGAKIWDAEHGEIDKTLTDLIGEFNKEAWVTSIDEQDRRSPPESRRPRS
jgi:hypothetical protein